jgi:hypothetical protein
MNVAAIALSKANRPRKLAVTASARLISIDDGIVCFAK